MSISPQLIIWGAGGHGKVVLDVARALGYDEIFFVDDDAIRGGSVMGCDVLTPTDTRLHNSAAPFVIAIGNNVGRARCFGLAEKRGWRPAALIHPSATVSLSAVIGAGTVVMPRVVVNACAVIGRNCILNSGAVIEHDCLVEDHVHIAPSAALAGNVHVGAFAQVSLAAAVLPALRIGCSAIVGAGAVVTKPVPEYCTVIGVPAQPLEVREMVER
jgi:sugar O-acyltransferase (sialic acid O-acetyltransferase NeuD family)